MQHSTAGRCDREEAYVHYLGPDRRLDEYPAPRTDTPRRTAALRTRTASTSWPGEVVMTEQDYQHHKQIFAQRNFEHITSAQWQIKT